MLYVTSLDGRKIEPLINVSDDFRMEQSVDGDFMISFSCFPSDINAGYDILTSESVITVEGNDFKVKQYSETAFSKTVTATSIFFELIKVQKIGIFEGSHTLNNHLSFAFDGTGWSYTVDSDISGSPNFIENLGNDNIISLVEKITKYHEIEYLIMPGKSVKFSKRIGPNNDFQYRYKHNVSDVILTQDTTNLYTFIRGYGADGLEVSYTSPNLQTFGRLEAAPVRDDRFTNASALNNYIKKSIVDVPELAIESRIPELTSRNTGETVWLIYEPLNIEMQTRILKQTKTLIGYELVTESVVLGNTLMKSSIDILVDQKKDIEDNKDYINETNDNLYKSQEEYRSRFDVTERNITLQVERIDESIATVDIKADNINLSVNNRITEEVAAIDIRANEIDISVNNRITSEVGAIQVRTDMIDIGLYNLDMRTSSSINLLQNNINLKVDVGGSITDINLSPGNATINADRINLNGAVFVNGMITGSTSIQVNTDVILGRRLQFNDFTALTTGGGNLTLEAFNDINYVGSRHYFNGTVDFSNANVIGLP